MEPVEKLGKTNSIGFLRLALAAVVLLVHSFELGGFGGGGRFGVASRLAVDGFFLLSGFLIAQSYVKSNSFLIFAWHRMLRIMPAFWVCLVVVGLGFGPLFALKDHVPFHAGDALAYMKANSLLTLKADHIGTLLARNPFPYAVNGSLWTLVWEAKCYALVGLLGICGLLRSRWVVGALTGLLTLAYLGLYYGAFHGFGPRNAELFAYFLVGSCLYVFGGVKLDARLFAASIALSLLGFFWLPALPLLLVSFSYAVVWFAWRTPRLTKIGNPIDISYGVYIYAFPVQQLLAGMAFAPFLIGTVAITVALAWLSFMLVERHAAKLKHVFSKKPSPVAVVLTDCESIAPINRSDRVERPIHAD